MKNKRQENFVNSFNNAMTFDITLKSRNLFIPFQYQGSNPKSYMCELCRLSLPQLFKKKKNSISIIIIIN